MVKKDKSKSKGRLDKYYHQAKEQGFRSRASFKLIQINKKFNFLSKASILVDLCAAPGSWLQVASKHMGSKSIIIGIDLDPIPHIPRVKTFQQDITQPECINLIRREIKTAKVDVVLNDGAPNVGADWKKDAFTQSELVLHSLKLACTVLRKGGTFVTKVFRSADYNSLVWAMNKFFEKVEACKPDASRHTSAEIFLVGVKYTAPDFIDPKFFDPGFVFKDNEATLLDLLTSKEVNSVDKVFERRNAKRRVIDTSTTTNYKKIDFEHFLKVDNPYPVFVDFNAIEISEEAKQKYEALVKAPKDYEDLFKDLLLLGKREITALLKWRTRIRTALDKQKKQEAREAFAKQQVAETGRQKFDSSEDEDELEQELQRIKRRAERQKNKEREKSMAKYASQGLRPGEEGIVQFEQEIQAGFFEKHGDLMREGELGAEEDEEEETEEARKRRVALGGIHHEYKEREAREVSYFEMEQQFEDEYDMMKKAKGANYRHERQKDKAKRTQKQRDEGEEVQVGERQMRLQDDEAGLLKKRVLEEMMGGDEDGIEVADLGKSRFFDRDAFKVLAKQKKVKVAGDEDADEEAALAALGKGEEDEDEGMDIETQADDFDDDDDEEEGMDVEEEEDDDDDDELGEEDLDDDDDELSEGDLEDETPGDTNADPDFAGYMDGIASSQKAYLEDLEMSGKSKKQIKREALEAKAQRRQAKKREREEAKRAAAANSDESSENEYEKRVKDTGKASDSVSDSEDPFAGQEYDGRYDLKVPLTEREKRKRALKKAAKKKERREAKAKKNVETTEVEVVPTKKFEDYDADELAQDLAVAKKMLRKKDRIALLDASINKRNYLDDPEDLPRWFVEDERRHNVPNVPITKEEVAEEKRILKALNAMPPKKVQEAKMRKKNRLIKEMKKFKDKAEEVYQAEDMDQRTKLKQIAKMKNQVMNRNKSTKKAIIVSKNKMGAKVSSGRKTQGRKYKVVDKRMKKDLRAQKRAQKQNHGRSKSHNSGASKRKFKRKR